MPFFINENRLDLAHTILNYKSQRDKKSVNNKTMRCVRSIFHSQGSILYNLASCWGGNQECPEQHSTKKELILARKFKLLLFTILSENQSYFVSKPDSLRIIEGERKLENCSGQISFQDLYEKVKDSRGSLSRVKKRGRIAA